MYDPRPDEVILLDEYHDRKERRMNPDPLHVEEEEFAETDRRMRFWIYCLLIGLAFGLVVVGLR